MYTLGGRVPLWTKHLYTVLMFYELVWGCPLRFYGRAYSGLKEILDFLLNK
jgi:hypothetical protein